uniref:RxLR effector candidate protein n=1 Tax=Hyaloperonospora arabidopsidis (strain Emoy2) TaxID=559515 RepID=M4BS38_HYAAE
MSPNDVGGEAHEATPAVVADGQEMTNGHELEENSAVRMVALDKMLAMLGDLSELVCGMELSQSAQGDQERKDSGESSIFNSALEAGAGVNLQALEHTTPPKRSPNVSPAMYFGFRRPAFAGVIVDTPAPVGGHHGMAHGEDPGYHVQGIPAGLYPGVGMPGPAFQQPGHMREGVPERRIRKLALQPFDGKELYHGLGSGFLEWGKKFVRQAGFSDRACGFVWPEDIKVDVLGKHLPGTA